MHSYVDVDSFPSAVQVVDDSDAPNAANLNTAPEGLANRTYWLKNRLGSKWVFYNDDATHDDNTFSTVASWTDTPAPLPDTNGFSLGYVSSSVLRVGDTFRLSLHGTFNLAVSGADAMGFLQLFYKGVNGHATYSALPGGLILVRSATTSAARGPFAIVGAVNLSSVETNMSLAVAGYIGASVTSVAMIGSWSAQYLGYRSV